MTDSIDDTKTGGPGALPARKPWSAPRIILSEMRSAEHLVGKAPSDKTNFVPDQATTPAGSTGS
jgi:hypothetical protein